MKKVEVKEARGELNRRKWFFRGYDDGQWWYETASAAEREQWVILAIEHHYDTHAELARQANLPPAMDGDLEEYRQDKSFRYGAYVDGWLDGVVNACDDVTDDLEYRPKEGEE